jgi:hypothetical protein
MTRRLVVQPQSDLDIQAATLWYGDQRSGLGVDFLNELDQVFQRISENPQQFPQLEHTVRRLFSAASLTGYISSSKHKT